MDGTERPAGCPADELDDNRIESVGQMDGGEIHFVDGEMRQQMDEVESSLLAANPVAREAPHSGPMFFQPRLHHIAVGETGVDALPNEAGQLDSQLRTAADAREEN